MREIHVRTPGQLGAVLQGFRRDRGLTQQALANLVGIDQTAISRIETDPSRAGLDRIMAILAALGVDVVLRPRGAERPRSEW